MENPEEIIWKKLADMDLVFKTFERHRKSTLYNSQDYKPSRHNAFPENLEIKVVGQKYNILLLLGTIALAFLGIFLFSKAIISNSAGRGLFFVCLALFITYLNLSSKAANSFPIVIDSEGILYDLRKFKWQDILLVFVEIIVTIDEEGNDFDTIRLLHLGHTDGEITTLDLSGRKIPGELLLGFADRLCVAVEYYRMNSC